MMIETDFADDLLEEIEIEINKFESSTGININTKSTIPYGSDLTLLSQRQRYCLPYYSRGVTDFIQLSKNHYDLMINSWLKEHPELVENGVENTINKKLDDDSPTEAIHIAIVEITHNLLFKYKTVLEVTRTTDNLNGIQDEEKLLTNYLNYYQNLLESKTKQIDVFYGIVLNKKISDLILQIYIRFIHLRLQQLNPQLQNTIILPRTNVAEKIKWKGTQKELCELFVELQSKGWIEEIKSGNFSTTTKSICNLFNLSSTQKNTNSNFETSFYQILKGNYNSETKKREHEEVLGKNYNYKFSEIQKNKRHE